MDAEAYDAAAACLLARLAKGTTPDEWHEAMSTVADPKRLKYAKALARMLSCEVTLYIACEYTDPAVLELVRTAVPSLRSTDLHSDLGLVRAVNRLLLTTRKPEALAVALPTREEIGANIAAHRKAPAVRSSVPEAFNTALAELGAAAKVDLIRGTDKEMCTAWAKMIQGGDFSDRSALPEAKAWTVLERTHADAVLKAVKRSDEAWSCLQRLTQLATLTNAVPTNMMSRIESMANKLATNIQAGQTSLENLNLQMIGEEVLKDCSADDLSQLTGSIDKLMPALQGLSSDLKK